MTAGKARASPQCQKPSRPKCEKTDMAALNGLDNNEEVKMDIDDGENEKIEAEEEVERKGPEREEAEEKEG